jgi:hypothetical protein
MATGHEKLHRVNEALNAFEEAVVAREHRTPLTSKIPLQQEVDTARAALVKVVVELVTEARMESANQ